MFGSVTIYYGMSGAFKGSTISALFAGGRVSDVMYSGIKPWKKFEKIVGSPVSDLNFATLHLCNLEEFKSTKLHWSATSDSAVIERGVSDMLFYYCRKNPNSGVDQAILDAENSILQGAVESIKRVLLVQRDEEFIKNVVIKEPTRAKEFTSVEDYLAAQEEYVEFTKKYNKIDDVVDICNARDYIESIGLSWKLANN